MMNYITRSHQWKIEGASTMAKYRTGQKTIEAKSNLPIVEEELKTMGLPLTKFLAKPKEVNPKEVNAHLAPPQENQTLDFYLKTKPQIVKDLTTITFSGNNFTDFTVREKKDKKRQKQGNTGDTPSPHRQKPPDTEPESPVYQ